jgi:hypothetical protein
MKKQFGPVRLQGWNEKFSASCEYDGAKYHLWVDRQTMQPKRDFRRDTLTVYKNAGDRTRYLDGAKGVGKLIAEYLLAEVPKLYPALLAQEKAQDEADAAVRAQKAADERVKEHAHELRDALRGLLDLGDRHFWSSSNKWPEVAAARTAIALATGVPIDDDTGKPIVRPAHIIDGGNAYWLEPISGGLRALMTAPLAATTGAVLWDEAYECDPRVMPNYEAMRAAVVSLAIAAKGRAA